MPYFAKGSDGDFVLLAENEKVIRFSHEATEIVCEWKSIANLFVEAINHID